MQFFSKKLKNSSREIVPSLLLSTSSKNVAQSWLDSLVFPKHFSHSSLVIKPSPFFVKSNYKIEWLESLGELISGKKFFFIDGRD